MSVGHILPGDEIEVTLRYTEHLLATDKIYEFDFPTVVGTRFSNDKNTSGPADQWVANPYLTKDTPSPSTFNVTATVNAGLPLNYIACDTHPVKVDFVSDSTAKLSLQPGSKATDDRDFILKYRLTGDKIITGLLLHEDEKLRENFFLLTVQPPEKPKLTDIPDRDYVFVVDVSGSMNGFPLDTSKELLENLIGSLRPTDHFNILFFAGGNKVPSPTPLPATQANFRKALRMLDGQSGNGATQLLPALKEAFALPKSEGTSRSMVVVTDGYVSFERDAFDLIRDNLNDANVFTFGIGSSVNRFLIEGMALAGQGEPFIVTTKKHAKDEATRLRKLLTSPVLTDVEITFNDEFEAYDIEPRTYPDVFADRPVVVFGKYRGKPTGAIEVAGISGKEKIKLSDTISAPNSEEDNAALPYL